MNDEKQYLLVIAYYGGEIISYMFSLEENAMRCFDNVEYDNIKFSVAVFECGKFESPGKKIAERRPLNKRL
jgi:hypothetical protein